DRAEATEEAGLTRIAGIRGPLLSFAGDEDGRVLAVGYFVPEAPRSYDQKDLLLFEPGERRPRVITADHDFEVGDGISSDQHPPRGGGGMPLGFARGGAAALAVMGHHGSARLARFDLKD